MHQDINAPDWANTSSFEERFWVERVSRYPILFDSKESFIVNWNLKKRKWFLYWKFAMKICLSVLWAIHWTCRLARFTLDETTISLDSTLLHIYYMHKSLGWSSIWTLLPVLCGKVKLIGSLLLQRCQYFPVGIIIFTTANIVCVGTPKNATQTDETWL